MPRLQAVLLHLVLMGEDADYVGFPMEYGQHISVIDMSTFYADGSKLLTSLIGMSVPRMRLTSRKTWYILGRCWGFSRNIDAAAVSYCPLI